MYARPQRPVSCAWLPFRRPLSSQSGHGTRGATRWGMRETRYGEGPLLLRLLLVLSSMSPLFVLWAIRGTTLMPEWAFWITCGLLFAAPNAFLLVLILRVANKKIQRTIQVGDSDDRRQDLISYLFAMLLPFYTVDLSTWRNLAATIMAFLIVVVLFTSLNLQYMNFLMAVTGYHCLQVHTPNPDRTLSSEPSFMVITKSPRLRPGSELTGYLISATLLVEVEK